MVPSPSQPDNTIGRQAFSRTTSSWTTWRLPAWRLKVPIIFVQCWTFRLFNTYNMTVLILSFEIVKAYMHTHLHTYAHRCICVYKIEYVHTLKPHASIYIYIYVYSIHTCAAMLTPKFVACVRARFIRKCRICTPNLQKQPRAFEQAEHRPADGHSTGRISRENFRPRRNPWLPRCTSYVASLKALLCSTLDDIWGI